MENHEEKVLNDRAVASAVQVCGQRGWFDQLLRTLEVRGNCGAEEI